MEWSGKSPSSSRQSPWETSPSWGSSVVGLVTPVDRPDDRAKGNHHRCVCVTASSRALAKAAQDEPRDALQSALASFGSKVRQMLVETRARTRNARTMTQADAARAKLRHQLERRRTTTGDAHHREWES